MSENKELSTDIEYITTIENNFSVSQQNSLHIKNLSSVMQLKTLSQADFGRKSFICQICRKGFSRKDSLKVHCRIHTGDGLFVCSVCSKACTTKQELRRHFRSHSGERPFKCQHCGYSATLKVNLKKHIMIKHSSLF